ncbi:DUF427 domain-containing protein [Acidobacteriota bacterium]
MIQAIWKDTVIAESGQCIEVEGNQYFPPDSVKHDFLVPSSTTSVCPWKGLAHYYDVVVGEDINKDAAWYYPEPKKAATQIKDHVAFWHGVDVQGE